jgi:hypothetical protein
MLLFDVVIFCTNLMINAAQCLLQRAQLISRFVQVLFIPTSGTVYKQCSNLEYVLCEYYSLQGRCVTFEV